MTYKPAVMDHKRSWTAHTTSKKLNGLKIQKLNVKIQPACLNSGPALAGSLYCHLQFHYVVITNSSVRAATESPVEGGGRRETAPSLLFSRYLLKYSKCRHQTFKTPPGIIFTPCDHIFPELLWKVSHKWRQRDVMFCHFRPNKRFSGKSCHAYSFEDNERYSR